MEKKLLIIGLCILTFFLIVPTMVNGALTDGLVSYYSFDSDDTTDDLGLLNLSQQGGGHTFEAGVLGDAIHFDGSGSYLNSTDENINYSSYSFNMWVKRDTTATADDIFGRWGSNNGFYLQYNIGTTLINSFQYTGGNDGGEFAHGVDSTTWTMVTTTYDGVNFITYFNGTVKQNVTASGTVTDINCMVYFAYAAGATCTASQNNFDGLADEMGVWTRGITSTEITELYNGGAGYNPYSAPSVSNFSISCHNGSEEPTICSVHAESACGDFEDTGNSSYTTDILNNSACLWDIAINSEGFHDVAYTDYNVSTNLDVHLVPHTIPDVNFTYPVGQWTEGVINGTCSDTDNDTILSVSVNDTRFVFNESYNFTDWSFDWIAPSLENVNITVTCTDEDNSTGTAQKNLSIDSHAPVCAPLDNTPVDTGESFDWNVTCTDDLNLYAVNVSCSGGTNFSYYADNLNVTSFDFDNNTGVLTETMVCTWTYQDGHTIKDIKDKLNKYNTKALDNKHVAIESFVIIEYDPTYSTDGVELLTLDYSKKDRIKFDYKFLKKTKEKETYVFNVNAKSKLRYVENNLYNAWFVVDDYYWIDFALDNDDNSTTWEVYRVNDTTYKVIIKSELDELSFNSLGITNIASSIQTFTVVDRDNFELRHVALWIFMFIISMSAVMFGMAARIPVAILVGAMGFFVLSFVVWSFSFGFGMVILSVGLVSLLLFYEQM